MGIIYGKDAAVKVDSNVEPTVSGWWINYKGNLVPYVASNTQGGTGRKGGNIDWTGWYRQYGIIPLVFPGDSFTFIGSTDGTLGVTGVARCSRIMWEWDLETGGYITSTIWFGANGVLSPSGGVAADSSIPDPTNVKGLAARIDSVQVTNMRRMRLEARRDLRPYCVAESDGQMKRASSDLDLRAVWQVLEDDPAQYPVIQSHHQLEFKTATTPTYWTIRWMRIEEVDPFGVDRYDKRNPIGATIHATFNGFNGTSAGSVVNPAGATKWPV